MEDSKSPLDGIIYAGTFLTCFGGYLMFLKGPAATPQQYWFRVGTLVVGVLASLIALGLKAISSRRGDS